MHRKVEFGARLGAGGGYGRTGRPGVAHGHRGAGASSSSSWWGSDTNGFDTARFDTGGESAPAPVDTQFRSVANGAATGEAGTNGAGSGGWTGRLDAGGVDTGGESAPARGAASVADAWSGWGGGSARSEASAEAATAWGGAGAASAAAWERGTRDTGAEAASDGSGWAADAIRDGVERARAQGTGGGTQVASGTARTMSDATGLPGLEHVGADGEALADTDGSTARRAGGFGAGVTEALGGAVQDVWDTAKGAARLVTDGKFRQQVADGAARLARLDAEITEYVKNDPLGAARAAVDGVVDGAQSLYDRYQAARAQAAQDGTLAEFDRRFAGRVLAEGALAFVPLGSVGKLGRGAGVAGKIGEAANAADKGADLAGDAAKAAVATDATTEALRNGRKLSGGQPQIELDHIFEGEISAGRKGLQAKGFHHAPGDGVHPDAEVSSIRIAGKPNRFGVYEATVNITDSATGQTYHKMSTMFPDRLSRDEVVQAVRNAYNNATVKQGNKFEGPSGLGFDIRVYTVGQGVSMQIRTAFPLYTP